MVNFPLFQATPGINLAVLPDSPAFTVAFVSDGFIRTMGVSREEVTGKAICELFSKLFENFRIQGASDLAASLMHVINQKEPHQMQVQHYNFLNVDGFYRETYWKASSVPVLNDAGNITYIIHTLEEMTEQVSIEKHIAERTAEVDHQKAFIASILDASMHGIYALRAVKNDEGLITDFQYLFANDQISKFLRLPVDKIIGASMLQLLPENKSNGFFDLFCTLLETGETYHNETHFLTEHIKHWFDFAIVPLDNETLVVSIEDITEQKQALEKIEEQRNLLNSILTNSSNGISVSKLFLDETGKVTDALTIIANDAAVKYIGLPKEIYLSKKATEIEPSIISSPYYQACVKTLETGEPFIMQYQTESTGRWLELTVSRLDHEHLIHIFTDVTPIKEAQLQVEHTVDNLKRSNQNLEQFAYAASHDLKEPMRKIELFSNRLRDRLENKLEPEDKHYLNRILHSTNRMNKLIDDLLTYSLVSKEEDRTEDVNLNEKVQRVLEDLELQIEETNAIVRVGALPTVRGNRRQLQQLFQNLIGNALKYRKGDVQIEVNISSRLISGDTEVLPVKIEKLNQKYYLIEVADNGIGFERENAEKIFDMFTRLHGTAEYQGTGIGLSIAEKVVKNHCGHIWAESNLGEGAAFKVLLPAG